MLMVNEDKFNSIWTISKYVYGLVPILIGLDKFFFFIVDWYMYVSPYVASIVPPTTLVPFLGIVEIVTGLLILTYFPRMGAYMVAGLLGLVIINLFMLGGVYDIILRDVAIAFAYIMFGLLTELKETAIRQ